MKKLLILLALPLNLIAMEVFEEEFPDGEIQEEYSLAENNLSIAISLDPDYILAYENLILLNIKKNNLFLAKKYLNQLLSIDSDNIKAKKLLKSLN